MQLKLNYKLSSLVVQVSPRAIATYLWQENSACRARKRAKSTPILHKGMIIEVIDVLFQNFYNLLILVFRAGSYNTYCTKLC